MNALLQKDQRETEKEQLWLTQIHRLRNRKAKPLLKANFTGRNFEESKIFNHIGVQIQDAQFDSRLKVKEIISLWKSLYGGVKANLDELLEILEIKNLSNNNHTFVNGNQFPPNNDGKSEMN